MCINDKNSTLEELDNYKGYDVVIREMISKEIDRQYSFMKWNIAVQTFLFASITQLKNDKYLWAVIAIGILASISSFATYWVSEAKIKRILYFGMGIEDIEDYHISHFLLYGLIHQRKQFLMRILEKFW